MAEAAAQDDGRGGVLILAVMATNLSWLEHPQAWSASEFAGADLGDRRRTRRLVRMGRRVAERPGGTVTDVFVDGAEREGAYRFLESEHDPAALGQAMHLAAARRGRGEPFLFIPVDGSSLSFRDLHGLRDVGPIGNRGKRGRGVKVMSAYALAPDGTPVGMTGQVFWKRTARRPRRGRSARPFHAKESARWLEVMEQSEAAHREAGAGAVRWYQLDREGDIKEVLHWAARANPDVWMTVRASQDRRLPGLRQDRLWSRLEALPTACWMTLAVPAGPARQERTALIDVRAGEVALALRGRWDGAGEGVRLVRLGVVLARELGTTPAGEQPLEWVLLTTAPLADAEDARWVVHGYTRRWPVEELHRCWKSTYEVEKSQLLSFRGLVNWSLLKVSAAMRTERLKFLARNEPEAPATAEFSRDEIDAAILLHKPKGYRVGDTPPVRLVVEWIAREGGYTSRSSSGGPPGSVTIGRGLKRLEAVAQAIATLRELGHFPRDDVGKM